MNLKGIQATFRSFAKSSQAAKLSQATSKNVGKMALFGMYPAGLGLGVGAGSYVAGAGISAGMDQITGDITGEDSTTTEKAAGVLKILAAGLIVYFLLKHKGVL